MTIDEAKEKITSLRGEILFGGDYPNGTVLETAGLTPLAENAALQAVCALEQAAHFLTAASYHQAAALATLHYGGQ